MNVADELHDWLWFSKRALTAILERWIGTKVRVAYATPTMSGKTWDDLMAEDAKSKEEFAEHLATTMAVSDLLGRRRTVLEAEKAIGHRLPAAPTPEAAAKPSEPLPGWTRFQPAPQPVQPTTLPGPAAVTVIATGVSRVQFREAVSDIVKRNARVAYGFRAVQDAYAKGNVFALAKSTDEILTKRVQKLVASAIAEGTPRPGVKRAIAELGGWTENYAETVFTTNATTAYSAGRIAQARDPDIAKVCPAFELDGRTVPPSRPNHAAAVGLVAGTDDPIWARFMPPLGYNCTHYVKLIDKFTLRRRGLLREDGTVIRYEPPGFAAAHPDPGFKPG